jgi:hypothetical protein
MRRQTAAALVVLLGCWCAPALAQDSRAGADVVPSLVRVAWVERATLDPFAFAQMEGEARGILARLGLRLSLRRREPLDEVGDALRVVLWDGFAPDDRMLMGALVVPTSARGGARIWIFQPAVRSVASPCSLGPAAALRHGVALGRILSHEIVHALAPGLEHADEGLMARTLSAAGLDRPVTIDAATIDAVRCATTAIDAET